MKTSMLIFVLFLILFTFSITILIIYRKKQSKKYKNIISKLDYDKNGLIGIPILSELSKVRELIKNDELKEKLSEWDEIFEDVKENKLSEITDLITEADFLVERREYNNATKKIALIEMNLDSLRLRMNNMLEEIKVITNSEERNRSIITKLKIIYREVNSKYNDNIDDYTPLSTQITAEFKKIDMLFKKFEAYMDKNDYITVEKIVNELDDSVNKVKRIIDESPALILMATVIIPGKIEELNKQHYRMTRDGYVLDYLNIEYNIKEIKNKIDSIMQDLADFKIGSADVELKTIMDYFNSIYNSFDKEKESKDIFKENIKKFKYKLDSINKIVYDIYIQIDDIKKTYDLSENEINKFSSINKNLEKINSDYKILCEHGKGRTFAYSKLLSELDGLNNKLTRLQDDLDYQLKSITSMKDDETRANEQYLLIQKLLFQAKSKLKEYKIPVIPTNYFIEFKEADEAIREILKELNKKPIVIKILNIRVDTARDLVFKIYNKTNDMVQNVILCEKLIVYGNRYRSTYLEVNDGLNKATDLFNRGQYKKCLDLLVNILREIDPSIIEKFKISD